MSEKPGSMRCAVLALSWLLVFCSHLKTAAQNNSSVISSTVSVDMSVMLSPIASPTNETFMPTVMISNTIATSPSVINGGSLSVLLVPTSAIMMTSQLSVDTTMPVFIISITTTAISPVATIDTPSITTTAISLVATIDTPSTMVITTSVIMTSSSVIPMTTTIVITTSNPVPVPSGDEGDGSTLSTGAIIGIAAGGGTGLALLIILVICCCCCCCRYRKRNRQEVYHVSPTIQARPQGYVPQFCRGDSQRVSQRSLISLTDNLRWSMRRAKAKGTPEGTKLISTPL